MSTRSEGLGDQPIRGEEAWRMPGRLAPLHAPLPLAGRLVRVLCAVVEIAVLSMFHPRQDFWLRGAVALQFIRDDDPWHIRQPLEQFTEKLLRGLLIPTALHENIEHVTVLIDGPPQIVTLLVEGEKDLIQVPLVARPGAPPTQCIGIGLAKLATPLANGLVGNGNPPLGQQFLDVAVAGAKMAGSGRGRGRREALGPRRTTRRRKRAARAVSFMRATT